MLVLNIGYTAPINPPNTLPVLTASQIWTGLQYKVRRADKFVPIITGCEVLSEVDTTTTDPKGGEHVITRLVTFKPGAVGPGTTAGGANGDGEAAGKKVKEVCRLYAPCRVDFGQEDGTTIGNYVSEGAGGELYMTYVFQWRVEGVQAGSEEAKGLERRFREVS